MLPRAGVALAACGSAAAIGAQAGAAALPAGIQRAQARLHALDAHSAVASSTDPSALRGAIGQWRTAELGYGRLHDDALAAARRAPLRSRTRSAWLALADLAAWRARELGYSIAVFSGVLRGRAVGDGAKEGIGSMTRVEGQLRARVRAALAALLA